jgi:hypothetical protein
LGFSNAIITRHSIFFIYIIRWQPPGKSYFSGITVINFDWFLAFRQKALQQLGLAAIFGEGLVGGTAVAGLTGQHRVPFKLQRI